MGCEECNAEQKRFHEESVLALAERTIRRLWITVIVLIVALVGVCVSFFIYEAQFEDCIVETDTEIEAAQFGSDNFVVGGDMTYGTTCETEENDNQTDACP